MHIETARRHFTVDEYHQMAEAGIFSPKERVELIDGEIIRMSPIGVRHSGCVNRTNDLFTHVFRGRAVVSTQNSLRLSDDTEPQPDLALLRFRSDFYSTRMPTAEDTLLVLEVSDTTLHYDRDVKLSRFAAAGVPEVWIANLEENSLLVFRDPSEGAYQTALTLDAGDSISAAAFPETVFKVEDLLGV